MKTSSVGDVIGDWVVRALAVGLVLGILYGLLCAAGQTWAQAPWAVLVVVAFWSGMLVLIARRAPAAAPAPR